MLVYFPLVHYICIFFCSNLFAKLLFQHPFLPVLQSNAQLLLTQMFVSVTVRSLEHMELCSNKHVGHLQASTYIK